MIYIEIDGSKQILQNTQIQINKGSKQTINQDYTITQPFNNAKLGVELVNKQQEIHFWVKQQ
ncbi:hypothetical protein ACFLZX_02390 [Nanoarchaeota archaeon]